MKIWLHYIPPPQEQEFELPEECPRCSRKIEENFTLNGVVVEERVRDLKWQKSPFRDIKVKGWHPSEEGDPGDLWITAVSCSWCGTSLAEAQAPAPLVQMALDVEHNRKKEK